MANEVLPTCGLLQHNKISNDHQNNIMIKSFKGDIALDHQIMTHDDWVARIKFLHENNQEKTQCITAHKNININDLHVELAHPSKVITNATTKSICIQVAGTFKLCEDCTLGKAKEGRVCKKSVAHSKILG